MRKNLEKERKIEEAAERLAEIVLLQIKERVVREHNKNTTKCTNQKGKSGNR